MGTRKNFPIFKGKEELGEKAKRKEYKREGSAGAGRQINSMIKKNANEPKPPDICPCTDIAI